MHERCQHVHHLGKEQHGRTLENRVIHVCWNKHCSCPRGALDKGKHPLLHGAVHFPAGKSWNTLHLSCCPSTVRLPACTSPTKILRQGSPSFFRTRLRFFQGWGILYHNDLIRKFRGLRRSIGAGPFCGKRAAGFSLRGEAGRLVGRSRNFFGNIPFPPCGHPADFALWGWRWSGLGCPG